MISLFSGISLHADAFLSRVEGTRSLVPVSRLISARKPVVLAVLVLALGLILAPDAAAQAPLSIPAIEDQTFTVGTAVDLTLPAAIGGTPPYSYNIEPAVPAGLSLAANVLSGRPTTAQPAVIYRYSVRDGAGVEIGGMFSITIITIIGNDGTLTEDEVSVDGMVFVNNMGGRPFRLEVLRDTPGLYGAFSIDDNPGGGKWEYELDTSRVQTLRSDQTLIDAFTVTAIDDRFGGTGLSINFIIAITIQGRNDPPEVDITTPEVDVLVESDRPIDVTGTGMDVDDGETATLRYRWQTVRVPGQGSFDDRTESDTSWTAPVVDANTPVMLRLTATDASDTEGSAEVTVTVTPPIIIGGDTEGGVIEDVTVGQTTANGSLTIINANPADATTFVAQNQPGTYGTFSMDTGGGWTYMLANPPLTTAQAQAVQALRQGQEEMDVFPVMATVGARNITADVTITVTGANDAPMVSISAPNPPNPEDSVSVTAGTTIAVTGSGMDVDEGETDTLTYRWSTDQSDPLLQGSFANSNAADTTWTAPPVTEDIDKITLTLTATDDSGTANASVTAEVTVRVIAMDVVPDFGGQDIDDQLYVIGADVALTLPAATGGNGELSYSLRDESGNLPRGLTFDGDEDTRFLSGMPTMGQPTTTYNYAVTDSDSTDTVDDSDTVSLSFDITVETDDAPDFGDATITTPLYIVGNDVNLTLPEATGGNGERRYDLLHSNRRTLGELGLSFNSNTRSLSGKMPRIGRGEFDYTVGDTDNNEDPTDQSKRPLIIIVQNDRRPNFRNPTIARHVFANGSMVDLTLPEARGGNGPLRYSILPKVFPTGLRPDDDARMISGIPDEPLGATTSYTYSVDDSDTNMRDTDRDTLRFIIDIFSIIGTDVGNVTEDGTAAQTMATGDLDIAPSGTANFVEQDDANGTYGSFEIGATGRWTYTLDNNDPDTNALAEGTTDTDTFTVTARATNTATHEVTITVTGSNDAPTAAITAPAETNLAVSPRATLTLIGTGSDPDATLTPDVLSYAWSATPEDGSFTDEVGSFTGSDVLNTAWTAPDTIDGLITLTLTINDNQGGSDTATVTVIMALSPDLNGDGIVQARDAQSLYYLALPDEPDNLNALLNPLRGTASVAQLRNRAMAWLNRNPAEVSPDLNGDRRLDQEDARLLYYALRFEDELQASRALREALGFGSDMMTLNQALNLR